MTQFKVGDDVCLSEDREGTIRYIGKIKGKAGTFYGIELTVGQGKHDGEYDGRRYFDCPPLKGIIVAEKQILFKLDDENVDTITAKYSNQLKNSKEKKKSIQNLGSNFVVKRKPGPREIGRADTSWKPPSWMKEFDNSSGSMLDERSNALAKKPYTPSKKQTGNVYIVGATGSNKAFNEKPMYSKATSDRIEHEKTKPKKNYGLTPTQPKKGKSSSTGVTKSPKLQPSPKNLTKTPKSKVQGNKGDEDDESGYAYWKQGIKDDDKDDEEDEEEIKKKKELQAQLEKEKKLELELEKQKEFEKQKELELELEKQRLELERTKLKEKEKSPPLQTKNEPPPRDYNIYFDLDIQVDDNSDEILAKSQGLEAPLAALFGVDPDRIIEVKALKRNDGFRIQFTVGIRTNLHPSDFIDVLDGAINDDKLVPIIAECYGVESPHIHMWEARYEKLEVTDEF